MAKHVGGWAEIFPDESMRKANFDAFEKRYGFRPEIDREEIKKYRAEKSEKTEPVLYIRNAMQGRDLRLNSYYDPSYEALVWAKGREVEQRKTAIVLCGFSTGVYVRALLKEMRPDTEVFVYEPLEALFSFVCSIADISDLIEDRRVHLFVADRLVNTMTDALHNHVVAYRPEISAVVTPFYSKDARFKQICDEVERLSIALRNFKKTRGRAVLRNRLYAWIHLKSAYLLSDMKGILNGILAVIVSAGPSLNKNVSELSELKEHAFILATDRALSILEKNRILPDAVISVDAEKSSDYLEYAYKMGIPVICSYQVNSKVQKKSKGRCIYFDETSYERKLLGEENTSKGALDMGGNVAGAAFTALRILGAKTIILVGQDLAYSAGQHHADGIDEGMDGVEDIIEIPGIDGRNVKSNTMWIKYRDYFVRQIKQNPDIRLIDATEGGALIEGSEIKTLRDTIDEICTCNILSQNIFANIPKALDDVEWKKASEILDGWMAELKEIAVLAENLWKVCDELISLIKRKGIDSAAVIDELQKFDEFRRKLYKLDMNSLLEEFWVEDMYSIPARELYVRTEDEAIMTFEQAGEYYEQLVKDALSLGEELDMAMKK